MASSPLAAFAARDELRAASRQISIDDIPRKLDQLAKAASTRNAYPKETLIQLVEQLSSYANTHGLSHDQLEKLLRILTLSKTFLDGPKIRVLVKSLVPQTKIKQSTVIHLIGRLGEGQDKAVYATQALLLRWLVMVYEFLESYTVLHQLYGLLFNFLHTANLRPHACHLLALCTRRKDVKPFRIQTLMRLFEEHGDESGVIGLLQIFQSFYPDVILRGTRKRSMFKIWDPIWIQNTSLIQSRREDTQDGEISVHDPHRRRSNRILTKSKRSVVPILHTFDALETSITLEEIETTQSLVENFQILELPSQIGAIFQDDMLRNFVLLKGSEDIISRLDNWTSAALLEEFDVERASGSVSERLEVFLNQILDYTTMRQALLPSVHEFLKDYIPQWNGRHHRNAILGLASFIPFSHLSDLKSNFFSKLEDLLKGPPLNDAIDLTRFHTAYMRNLVIQYSAAQNPGEAEIRKAIRDYINYVGQISTQILVTLTSKNEVISYLQVVLEFYDCVSRIPLDRPVFEITYPVDTIVYSSVFSGDPVSFSRLCGILAKYKQLFIDHTELRSKDPRIAKYGEPDRSYVDYFNGYLMDISNLFWRFRSFSVDSTKDTNALGCLMLPEMVTHLNFAANARELSLNGIFTLTHSAIFSRFNADCMRFLEDRYEELKGDLEIRHAGPITSKSLAGLAGDGGYQIDYRVFKMASLEYLRRKGFDGVHALIYSTMKKLREEVGKYNVEAMFEGLEEWAETDS